MALTLLHQARFDFTEGNAASLIADTGNNWSLVSGANYPDTGSVSANYPYGVNNFKTGGTYNINYALYHPNLLYSLFNGRFVNTSKKGAIALRFKTPSSLTSTAKPFSLFLSQGGIKATPDYAYRDLIEIYITPPDPASEPMTITGQTGTLWKVGAATGSFYQTSTSSGLIYLNTEYTVIYAWEKTGGLSGGNKQELYLNGTLVASYSGIVLIGDIANSIDSADGYTVPFFLAGGSFSGSASIGSFQYASGGDVARSPEKPIVTNLWVFDIDNATDVSTIVNNLDYMISTSTVPSMGTGAYPPTTLNTSGTTDTVTFSGTMPTGLVISNDGIITGTPTTYYTPTTSRAIAQTDTIGLVHKRNLSFGSFYITSASLTSQIVGTATNVQVEKTGGAAPISWSII